MTFIPVPKQIPLRSPRLLTLAKIAPRCFSCHEANRGGNIVAAHLNALWAGKGTGQKAHDIPAFLCGYCHDVIDGRVEPWHTPEDREMKWLRAQYLTLVWLLQEGHLKVAA